MFAAQPTFVLITISELRLHKKSSANSLHLWLGAIFAVAHSIKNGGYAVLKTFQMGGRLKEKYLEMMYSFIHLSIFETSCFDESGGGGWGKQVFGAKYAQKPS